MTCKNCGAPLEEGTRFCNRCGAAVVRQPSREEIRARVQGGGRHAPAHAVPARASVVGGNYAPATLGAQHTPLLCLVAGLLGILQIVYLFVNTLFVTIASGQTDFGVMRYSFYGALRQQGSTGFGVVLVLLCLVVLGSIAVPMILSGRPRSMITAGLSCLLLVLYVIAIFKIRGAFSEDFLGAKPKLGFYGWLFILNCFLIPGLVYLAGQVEDIEPAPVQRPAPAPAPAARRTAQPAQTGAKGIGVNTPIRRAVPGKNVTPPDADTIAALRRMVEMHKQGLVSDEEFARIKAECVARGWIRE